MQFTYTTVVLMSFSIFIAGIAGIFRFNQIRDIYKPFIYLIWIGCFNEVLSFALAVNGHYTIINGSIYSLCESIFLLWFFKRLGVLQTKAVLYSLISVFIIIWVVESFFANQFGTRFTSWSDIFYSFCVVLLSIRAVNDLLFTEKDLLKNPTFLICIGLMIFFTYEIIERMFRIYGLKNSMEFRSSVGAILTITNFLTNLIYGLAVLWMRKREAFTLRF
jgi:hypothetical protein